MVYTVICTYKQEARTPRLFYDSGEFRTKALAISTISAQCPAPPTDILVFKGEMDDLDRTEYFDDPIGQVAT